MRIAIDEKAIFGGEGKPSPDAVQTLRNWSREGHTLFVLTAPARSDAVLSELKRQGITATIRPRFYDLVIDADSLNPRVGWGALQGEVMRRGSAKQARYHRPNADLERIIDRLSREE